MDSLPIMVFLFITIAIVVAACLFYSQYINMKDEGARQIEVIGYCALIIVIIWEFIVKNILMGDFNNSDVFYLSQKMDYIYRAVTDGTRESYSDPNYWNMKTGNIVHTQILTVNIVGAILQIGSAVCIAIGRAQDLLKYKNKGNPET